MQEGRVEEGRWWDRWGQGGRVEEKSEVEVLGGGEEWGSKHEWWQGFRVIWCGGRRGEGGQNSRWGVGMD